MYPKIQFHYSNIHVDTDSPVLSNCIKLGE